MNKEFLDILKCLKCNSNLDYNKENNTVICKNCKKTYKIENNILIMIEKE